MPVIIVYGVPDQYSHEKLKEFLKKLQNVVKDYPKLQLSPDQVSVFFPRDILQKGLGEEIIIFVEGFFNYEFRTIDIRNAYVKSLGKIAKDYFPGALVESFIKPFNDTSDGFWGSGKNN